MDKQAIAKRYLSVTYWLANRYAKTDKHGRRWLARVNHGKPTRYAMLEQAFKDKYFSAIRGGQAMLSKFWKRKFYVTVVWGKDNPDNKDSYNFESEAERSAFITGLYEAKKHQGIDGLDLTIAREGYYDERGL